MLRDLAAWLLYSPRRLVAVVVPVMALTGIALMGLNGTVSELPTASVASGQRSSGPPTAVRSASQVTNSEKGASLREIRQTARKFVNDYVVKGGAATPRAVPSSLRNVTTPALWSGLRLTQPDVFPRGSIDQVNVESAGPFSGTVTVDLDSGTTFSVSVVAWQRGWRISDVRPADAP